MKPSFGEGQKVNRVIANKFLGKTRLDHGLGNGGCRVNVEARELKF